GLSEEQRVVLRDLLQSAQKFYRQNRDQAPGSQVPAPAFSMPYSVAEIALTARDNVPYNGYAHAFAGMGIQFLLFAGIDLAVGILLERQRGLLKRIRSAPISRQTLLGAKAASGAVISLM